MVESEIEFKTPILFLVFNRLDETKKVFEQIKKIKPLNLYIASDGARINKEGEYEIVNIIRQYLLENIDWNCNIQTLFRDNNLGCKDAVSGAITWFFQNEEQGIILEDDCLPSESFFMYCETLLEYYKNDNRVGMISGFNKRGILENLNYDYFFTKFISIWGWATWRRAWNKYDKNLTTYVEFKELEMLRTFLSESNYERESRKFNKVKYENFDTWDYQWSYTMYIQNMLCIIPRKNMIKNIGFGDNATHTVGEDEYKHIELYQESFNKIIHPSYLLQSHIYDKCINRNSNFELSLLFNRFYDQLLDILNNNEKIIIYGKSRITKVFMSLFNYYNVRIYDNETIKNLCQDDEYDIFVLMVLGREDKVLSSLRENSNIKKSKIFIFNLEEL
jgi:hypothetical protein